MKYEFLKDKIILVQNKNILAELNFLDIGEHLTEVISVFVSPSLRGKGIANELMLFICKYAKENNRKIKPTCSYAKRWLESNENYSDLKI